MLKWNEVAKHFFLFEENHATEIAGIQINGYCVWGIIKTPLFHYIIKQDNPQTPAKNGWLQSKLRKFGNLIQLCFDILKLKLKGKQEGVLFYTYAGDKLSRNSQNQYFNFLVDGFITKGIVKNYLYIEHSFEGDYKKPSPVDADIKVDHLNELAFLFSKKIARDKEISAVSSAISQLINSYFRNTEINVSAETIRNILIGFFTGYKINDFLFRFIKPKLIVTSEKPGTSLLAVANARNIISIDLQHGLIDEYHPLYQYSQELKKSSAMMILPTYIGVFGKFHKEILLRNNFWQEEQIKIFGSIRLEEKRNLFLEKKKSDDEFYILVPTQWTVFEETKLLLNILLQEKSSGYKILLKPHPLEPSSNKRYYENFQQKNQDWLEIANQQSDIFELIGNSKIILGFDSTTLLECICLGVPSITIGLLNVPEGIHSLLGTAYFKEAIKCVQLNQPDELLGLIKKAMLEKKFYQKWSEVAFEKGKDLYATDYFENIQTFIRHIQALKDPTQLSVENMNFDNSTSKIRN